MHRDSGRRAGARWTFVPKRPGAPVLTIAHRGARAVAPENTLEAIDKAARLGADMVELDVRLARDGALVVVHDDDLERCSDVRARFPGRPSYRVADFTLAEIRQLDAGGWFVAQLRRPRAARQTFLRSLTDEERERYLSAADLAHYGSGAVRVPTLEEALERARELALPVVIEIKADGGTGTSMAVQVVELVASLGLERQVVVSSFDPAPLIETRRRSSRVATGVLTRTRVAQPGAYVRRVDADAYHPSCASIRVRGPFGRLRGVPDRRLIGALRAAGIAVNVWTENDPIGMRALIEAGVTGIFTDYPHRLRAVVDTMSG